MDVFILDALLRPIDVVDEFESIIWTERYAEMGDFELVTRSTPSNRKRFVYDTMISIPDSKRIMRVETIEETEDLDKGTVLKIKGRELVSILEQRSHLSRDVFEPNVGMIKATSGYYGWTPKELMVLFVFKFCYPPCELSDGDEIPFLQIEGTLYPEDTNPELGSEGIEWSQKPASLYSSIVDVSKAYDTGFRLYKDPNASKLYFEGYVGCDRTSAQTVHPPVIFSSDMTNLQGTTEFSDNTKHFNVVVAIYYYKDEFDNDISLSEIVSDPELAFSSGGFDQKTKFISITQLPEGMEIEGVPAYLQQLAKEELTRSRPSAVYDGEIDQSADFIYERDYYLGDIVEVRGNNGGTAYMRVVEQIIKEDSNGKTAYPSLITKTSINPGTWASWKYDIEWSAMGSEEYWSNQ
jgi:hypothetical protein